MLVLHPFVPSVRARRNRFSFSRAFFRREVFQNAAPFFSASSLPKSETVSPFSTPTRNELHAVPIPLFAAAPCAPRRFLSPSSGAARFCAAWRRALRFCVGKYLPATG